MLGVRVCLAQTANRLGASVFRRHPEGPQLCNSLFDVKCQLVAHFLARQFPPERVEVKQPPRTAHEPVRSARMSASARA